MMRKKTFVISLLMVMISTFITTSASSKDNCYTVYSTTCCTNIINLRAKRCGLTTCLPTIAGGDVPILVRMLSINGWHDSDIGVLPSLGCWFFETHCTGVGEVENACGWAEMPTLVYCIPFGKPQGTQTCTDP